MPFTTLKQSAHLRTLRFSSPEEFLAIGLLEIERQKILGPYSHLRAITALPGVVIMLERTSPRHLCAYMNTMGCVVIVPMVDSGIAVCNGQTWSSDKVGLLRGRAPFELTEQASNIFAVIRFSADMQNRGWDDADGRLHLKEISADKLLHVRLVIRNALRLTATPMSHLQFAGAAQTMREELIAALDQVLISHKIQRSTSGAFERHRRLVSRLDELIDSRPTISFTSEELAQELGRSIRTLQTAVESIYGTSLHKHLRNRRLWSLRAELTRGLPHMTVSSAAYAKGFSHMSELSRVYKLTFGELPSETLLRARQLPVS